jgi:hypothetical protein
MHPYLPLYIFLKKFGPKCPGFLLPLIPSLLPFHGDRLFIAEGFFFSTSSQAMQSTSSQLPPLSSSADAETPHPLLYRRRFLSSSPPFLYHRRLLPSPPQCGGTEQGDITARARPRERSTRVARSMDGSELSFSLLVGCHGERKEREDERRRKKTGSIFV